MQRAVKIVTWDSIGNTVLGVRPWTSWEPRFRDQLMAERENAETQAPSYRQILADYDVELIWFNSAGAAYKPFGTLFEDYATNFRATQSVDEIAREIQDADFLILHKELLPGDAISSAVNLKLIQHLGQDFRGVPMDAARSCGIPVAATPLINYITVAEHCWAFILNWAKRLPALRQYMAARDYGPNWNCFPNLQYLGDLTLGLLGMGEIARPIAKVAHAFGMPTVYWDIRRFPDLEAQYGMRFVEWDDIFSTSDVLSVQLALNDRTEGIIGAREIGLMKPTALFMNTARGKLVDQAALTAALAERRIGGVALDVFAEEPLPIDDPLLALHDGADERVTLTPHCAWQSPWTWIRDSQELWFNIKRVLDGEQPRHLVS